MKMRKQRLMGVGMVIISWLLLLLPLTGPSLTDQDVTAVLQTLPLGIYIIFSEEYILYP